MDEPDGFRDALAVTPSDSADLAWPTRALYVGGAGAVSIDPVGGGTAIVIGAVPAGTTIRVQVKRVRATGTTATSIVALR